MISWGFGNRIEKFNGQLKIYRENCKEYFYFFGLYRTLFSLLKKKEKKDKFDFLEDEDKLKIVLGCGFFEELAQKRDFLILT